MFIGSVCEHSLYECGIQIVGIFKISVKQLLGRDPAKFGITWILFHETSPKFAQLFQPNIIQSVLEASKFMLFRNNFHILKTMLIEMFS